MDKKEESKEKDIFDMSDEEFANIDIEEVNEEINEESEQTSEKSEEQTSEESDESFVIEDFTLEEEEEEEEEGEEEKPSGQDDRVTIIHNGQQIQVTQQELVNLAQKGFDYEAKTKAIAPHRRLIELVNADKSLKDVINDHVTSKFVEVDSRENYDNEDEWMAANLKKTVSKVSPFIGEESVSDPATEQSNTTPEIVTVLQQRDPENFQKIVPYFGKAAETLTKAQYDHVASSTENVIKFYDQVKAQVMKVKNVNNKTVNKKKTFNLRSNQGNRSNKAKRKTNVWDLPNDQFGKILKKVKGY